MWVLKGGNMTAQELISARKSLGITMRDMAALLDVSYRTYQSWEWGKKEIPQGIKVCICFLAKSKKQGTEAIHADDGKDIHLQEFKVRGVMKNRMRYQAYAVKNRRAENEQRELVGFCETKAAAIMSIRTAIASGFDYGYIKQGFEVIASYNEASFLR